VPAAGWSAEYRSGAGTGVTVADAEPATASGTLIGFPAFAKGPIRFDLEAGTVGFPVTTATPNATGAPQKKNYPRLPFHTTGKKGRSLPDTGVPMSAALGAVTALTALLAGIGTVVAARRRPDHEC
jgi:hypothetical protein